MQKNNHGYAPLHNACWDGHLELVKCLLAANAHHDMQTNDGNTPLSLACHGSQPEIVVLLLPLGCNVNNHDKDKDMPLHYSTYNGDVASSQALLQCAAKPDACNRLACTPMWNAAYRAQWKVVRLLLQYNPDLSIRSVGIQQEAQTEGVTECFDTPKSVLYAACFGCSHPNVDADNPTVQIIVQAGLRLQHEPWLVEWMQGVRPEWLREELWQWMWQEVASPPPLLRLCRTLVRDMLRGWCNLESQVTQMEIPYTLKAYLVTKHL